MSSEDEMRQVALLAVEVLARELHHMRLEEELRQDGLRCNEAHQQLYEACKASAELGDRLAAAYGEPVGTYQPLHPPPQGVAKVESPTESKPRRSRRSRKPKPDAPPPNPDDEPAATDPTPPPGAPLTAAHADECPGCQERSVVWDPALGDVICRNCSRVATEEYIKRAQQAPPPPAPDPEASSPPGEGGALPQVRRRPRKQLKLPGVK